MIDEPEKKGKETDRIYDADGRHNSESDKKIPSESGRWYTIKVKKRPKK